MDSLANNDFCDKHEISAYIQARDFGNKKMIKNEKHFIQIT